MAMVQADAPLIAVNNALSAFRRVLLSHGETPIEPLHNLSRHLGVRVLVKRDDCTGLAMGGNKVRQLEFYLGQAAEKGADTILITGAKQSNFVRLAAAAARRLGWHPVVQLEDRVAMDDAAYHRSGNLLLTRLLGAEIHHFPHGEDEAAADANLEKLAARLRREGRRPYVIHLGIDHPPIGGLGYVAAAAETHEQIRKFGHNPDFVVVPSGSGLTHAGFLVGARALKWPVPIMGVCVRRDAASQHKRVLQRARELVDLLGIDLEIRSEDVVVDDDVLAPGYGLINEPVRAAIRLGAESEALLLDPVYSGRCMAGLMGFVASGRIRQGCDVLFLHTGGAPALFAYESEI